MAQKCELILELIFRPKTLFIEINTQKKHKDYHSREKTKLNFSETPQNPIKVTKKQNQPKPKNPKNSQKTNQKTQQLVTMINENKENDANFNLEEIIRQKSLESKKNQ